MKLSVYLAVTEQCVWHATVTSLQQDVVMAREMSDEKLSKIQRQTEDTVAAQQTAFDEKVRTDDCLLGISYSSHTLLGCCVICSLLLKNVDAVYLSTLVFI